MAEKFGRLALHMWTVDTTPLAIALDAAKQGGFNAVELRRTDFKRCFDAGMSNAQVLDLIKNSGIPCGVLGVEYGWLFATGDESKRLFKVFRESCENAVVLGCDTLMSAPGQVNGPIKDTNRNSRIGIEATGQINRHEYGLTWNKLIESGAPVVSSEVWITIDAEAVKKASDAK